MSKEKMKKAIINLSSDTKIIVVYLHVKHMKNHQAKHL